MPLCSTSLVGMSLCPRDRTVLEQVGANASDEMRCCTCDGLWLPANVVRAQIGRVKRPLGIATGESATTLFCPDDEALLLPLWRRGVEVDVCSQCTGVWLDVGELARILEVRATGEFKRTASCVAGEIGLHVGGGFADGVLQIVFEFVGDLFSGV